MKTKLALIVGFLSCFGPSFADEADEVGGWHVKPGSQRGKVAVIDTQSAVDGKAIRDFVALLNSETLINFVYEKANPGDPVALKTASKANVAVIVADNDTTPAMLLAPEDYWGVVNVRKVSRNLKTDRAKQKFLPSRTAKEVVRALSLLCGGGASQFPGNLMNIAKLEDVDFCNGSLPVDMIDKYQKYLAELGVTPAYKTIYEQACQEGWASQPTNDVQRKIWNVIHEIPSKPMKIKFDPNKKKSN